MTKVEENILLKEGKMLPVMEHFYTIQGEGAHTGKAAYFIRLGGCDVGCHWCDVKESWDPNLHPLLSTQEIAETAAKHWPLAARRLEHQRLVPVRLGQAPPSVPHGRC